MAWAEQWSLIVDGAHQLNSAGCSPFTGPYFAEIPELGWLHPQQTISIERDMDYPVVIGMQPMPASMNVVIQMKSCNWATWETQKAQLFGWLAHGGHTFTVQVRGMAAPLSFYAVVESVMTAPKARRLSVSLMVPKPVLT